MDTSTMLTLVFYMLQYVTALIKINFSNLSLILLTDALVIVLCLGS